ncbi:MAG: CHASE2 domain-containing sensor protein [Desulforhopalus sp.]
MAGDKRIWEVIISFCICALLFQTHFFPWLSYVSLDLLFKSRGIKETSQSIVIVGIDEQSLEKYGPWPFPRSTHALLLEQLKDAKVIGFDLIFSHPDSEDLKLAEAIDSSPPVAMALATNYQGKVLKPVNIFVDRTKLGHIETELGTDGIIRRIQLHKLNVPVLAAAMVDAGGVNSQGNSPDSGPGRLINFYGSEFTFLYLSYSDVLEGEYRHQFFEDRYVLIGSKALALGDVHITPFSKKHPVPGVEVQATILNNILDNSFLRELNWLVWTLSLTCFVVLVWLWSNKNETQNAIICIVIGTLLTILSVVLFQFNYVLNVGFPLFVILVSYLSHSIFWWVKITTGMIKEIRVLQD